MEDEIAKARAEGRIAGLKEAQTIAWEYRAHRAFADTRHCKDERGMGAQRVHDKIRARISDVESGKV